VAATLLLWLKFAAADVFSLTLPAGLQDFVSLALSIVVEALPFVILGALVSSSSGFFAPTQRLIQLLPKRPVLRRLSVSLLGKYVSSGGFDRTNTKLAVQPIGGDASYDALSKELQDLPNIHLGGRISTPVFLHNS